MFQYLTFKHAADNRPHKAPCTVSYGKRLFGMSEETRGQAYPTGLCFQSVLTHPNCLERQAGLAGHSFAIRAGDGPAPLGSASILWQFPARGLGGRRALSLFMHFHCAGSRAIFKSVCRLSPKHK